MTRFATVVGMQVMDSRSYAKHLKKVNDVASTLSKEVLSQSVTAARKAYQELDPTIQDDDTIDVTVSFDGSWQRRGFSSLYGVASVIDVVTGLILDFVVLSKFCHMCTLKTTELGSDSPEYELWHDEHIANDECRINYEGSSAGMETEAAVILCQRSEEHGKIRYVSILGDGDGKSVTAINKAQPYGADIEVKKEECVNHINKRLGTAMREAVKKSSVRGVALGGRGGDTLTQAVMMKLQRYYTKAILDNVPDCEKMQKGILATLYHCSSTDKKPKHQNCPKGESSWCFYNRGIAKKNKKKDLKHEDKLSIKLNQKVFDALLPIYERLSSKQLMDRCQRAATSNANEAFHAVLWKKCPKTTFVSKSRLDIAVAQSVSEFNMGYLATQALKTSITHEEIPEASQKLSARLDRKRKAQSDRQGTVAKKIQRAKRKRSKKSKQAREEKKTGDVYVPGGGD